MEEPVLKYTSGTKGDRPLFGYRNNDHLKIGFLHNPLIFVLENVNNIIESYRKENQRTWL